MTEKQRVSLEPIAPLTTECLHSTNNSKTRFLFWLVVGAATLSDLACLSMSGLLSHPVYICDMLTYGRYVRVTVPNGSTIMGERPNEFTAARSLRISCRPLHASSSWTPRSALSNR